MTPEHQVTAAKPPQIGNPSLAPAIPTLITTFGRIGLLSFGGPAAQISLMHQELVDRHNWLSEDQFLKALSFCMLLPGPEAMQLATYAGWRLRGVPGGLMAGLLFVIPGAMVIFALAAIYTAFGDQSLVHAAFSGIQATVVVIVLQALWRLSRKTLQNTLNWVLAGGAFLALFLFAIPFPLIIAFAALLGMLCATRDASGANIYQRVQISPRQTMKTIAIWSTLWLLPIAALWVLDQTFLTQIALFFSQLAVVTFGGAYAVLAYMTQAVVETRGWVSTPEMIDALGLAETTPGPLILVTQFVGFLAGMAESGPGLAIMAALITLWVTFCPCFLWIFAGAPYVENLLSRPRLRAALDAISAAVVGVILNLSLWFALNVLFSDVARGGIGPRIDPGTLSVPHLFLITIAGILIFGLRWSLLRCLPIMAVFAVTGAASGHF